MKHILFLTTNNLATNPRLTKEINLALANGFKATVLAFTLGNWSDVTSMEIKKGLQDKYKDVFNLIELEATPAIWIHWFFWGILEKCARKMFSFFKRNLFINALANTRRAIQLLIKVNSLAFQPNLIVAHNMGSLYPAYCLGKRHKIPFIFDMEDYHPGELASSDMENERKRREFLLGKLLPQTKAITSASPLIEKYTLDLIGGHHHHSVILNGFPESEFKMPLTHQCNNSCEALKLIWFGQKIGPGRGLEQLFHAQVGISRLDSKPIKLTLIGEWDENFKKDFFLPFMKTVENTSISVEVSLPIAQVELHALLCHYDIGLALEPGKDLNNNLALSNKIMAYAQAGLYILATNTEAQSQFINDGSDRGVLCGQSSSEIGKALEKLLLESETISEGKETRYNNGKKLAWKLESTKLIGIWNDAIRI